MKRLHWAGLALGLMTVGLAAKGALAQNPPEVLEHFRIVPRLSTLHETGGIAGIDRRYRLIGRYDLQHSFGWLSEASFENAEVWGSVISDLPTPAVVLDVDELLNLEGLKGRALPVGAPFDVYQFQGETRDGSSVELFAAKLGPWMYLRGGTEPPVGSADFFTYHLRALARSRPFADANGDGVVDTADYVALRKSRDGSGVGSVEDLTEGATFDDWRQQFGETAPDVSAMDAMVSAAMASYVAAAGVPEPACLILAIGGGMFVTGLRRRRL